MKLGIQLFQRDYTITGASLLKLLVATCVVVFSWFVWNIVEQRDYYRYKCDAYVGMIHQVMNVTKNVNPLSFNSWSSRMNDIKDSASNYGHANSDDKISVGTYLLDSSVIETPDSTETP